MLRRTLHKYDTKVVQRTIFREDVTSGYHSEAPWEDTDFTLEHPDQTLPGAHPLHLKKTIDYILRPCISPYMPSPHRVHPYFLNPVDELPHFDCSVPIVYTHNTIKNGRIIVPVFSIPGGSMVRDNNNNNNNSSSGENNNKNSENNISENNNNNNNTPTITHTRELDPFLFGFYPHPNQMYKNNNYWQVRLQKYSTMWEFDRREIWARSKKPWSNTGTGRYRAKDLKHNKTDKGARINAMKPWNMMMPSITTRQWSRSNRMMLTLKMLQGKLQIVNKLTLKEPSVESFLELCHNMNWDVRNSGGGVLFMDGGSRITPSFEFDRNFFYGSFFNGRCKLVRPTVHKTKDFDWNFTMASKKYNGPRGPKNPVPHNRFNCYDALDHSLLVITEGALLQLEAECFLEKMNIVPPHIRNQMAAAGMLDHFTMGGINSNNNIISNINSENNELNNNSSNNNNLINNINTARSAVPILPIELEAAGRVEEKEIPMYEPYYDNPYNPWKDECNASYIVDGVAGEIVRHVGGKKTSWAMLE